jgi:hypothetical protein
MFEPRRDNKMLHARKIVSKKKECFVFSVYHAIAATKRKPKNKTFTSGVKILKQYSIYKRNVWH